MPEGLFNSVIGDSLTLGAVLTALGCALVLGLFISLVYMRTHKGEGIASSFAITLIMLPAIIAIIILLVGNNVARAFSLAGAFGLIRFRSAPGDPKDIAYVFFTLGVGLACGMGYLGYAALFTVLLSAVMLVLHILNYAKPKSTRMQLKVIVPEDQNFQGLFDDILNRYTTGYKLKRIKTSDFGTMFEIAYDIELLDRADQKNFFDELRCRNGNLNISLTLGESGVAEYV